MEGQERVGVEVGTIVVRDGSEADRSCHAFDSLFLVELDIGQIFRGLKLKVFENRVSPDKCDYDEANKDGPESE